MNSSFDTQLHERTRLNEAVTSNALKTVQDLLDRKGISILAVEDSFVAYLVHARNMATTVWQLLDSTEAPPLEGTF